MRREDDRNKQKINDIPMIIDGTENQEVSYANEHDAFAASRSCEYVYIPMSDEYFETLNRYAETIEMDSKQPLVITGEPGIGKNALLSNWAKRRLETKHKDEFLFKYYVAASSVASKLSNMLHLLETALKDFFQLREMEVPLSEERLMWSLSRFLSAAAKRHVQTRIIIIIDGINALKGENMPIGTLHWLPIELPPGVRFIVSTIQHDDSLHAPPISPPKEHRTFTELKRRGCPMVKIAYLSESVQYLIIEKFFAMQCLKNGNAHCNSAKNSTCMLSETQKEQIVKVPVLNKPMYLRMLLYGLQLYAFDCINDGSEGGKCKADDLLNEFLSAKDTMSLECKILDTCASKVDGAREGDRVTGAVLSVLYASNDGLSDNEIWGAAEILLGYELHETQKSTLKQLLRINTMVVCGRRSFSHEEFRRVVYAKYISKPEQHANLHQQMARYFSRLPVSDRRVWCLPYHLEVAGNWIKLKSSLVDISMLDLWWTAKHKERFLSLWSSLTLSEHKQKKIGFMATNRENAGNNWFVPPKPCFDLVEEYCHALEEYKDRVHPSDARIGAVIMKIADFLLEYAALGYEEAADVPVFVHPNIPHSDLASLGVEYISVDEDGFSSLHRPVLAHVKEENKQYAMVSKSSVAPQCSSSSKELPVRSTYFYHRWMWVQFPSVALANCGVMYEKGIELRRASEPINLPNNTIKPHHRKTLNKEECIIRKSIDKEDSGLKVHDAGSIDDLSASLQSHQRLPGIGVLSPVKPRIRSGEEKVEEDSEGYWVKAMISMQDEVVAYRTCLDTLVQKRMNLNRKLANMENEELTLGISVVTQADGEEQSNELRRKREQVMDEHKRANQLANNYLALLKMCQRHPAHCRALIAELEIKLSQDIRLIEEIRRRLQCERDERIRTLQASSNMRRALISASNLQREMLDSRYRQHMVLRSSINRTLRTIHQDSDLLETQSLSDISTAESIHQTKKGSIGRKMEGVTLGQFEAEKSEGGYLGEEGIWKRIACTTGINDPELFASKFLNTGHLEQQIKEMKRIGEIRLSELKSEAAAAESELGNIRYVQLSGAGRGGNSGGKASRTLHVKLSNEQAKLRNRRETAYSIEKLRRRAMTGLKHICELLGIPAVEPQQDFLMDSSKETSKLGTTLEGQVMSMVHQVEFVLDSIMNESDKTASQSSISNSTDESLSSHDKENYGGRGKHADNMGGNNIIRPPEVEAALQQYSNRKTRMAMQLTRNHDDTSENSEDTEFDEDSGIHTVPDDREAVKTRSSKKLKAEFRRLAKLKSAAVTQL